MKTIEVTIGSISESVEVGFTIEKGQKGSYEREEIQDKPGEYINLDLPTLKAIGLYEEIYLILDEMLAEGQIQ